MTNGAKNEQPEQPLEGRPRTDETVLAQKRYDRQASLFDFMEAPIEFIAFKPLRKRLWSEIHGERLLEVGVGTGKNLGYHPEGIQSIAIDLSPRMLERAARRAERSARHVDLILADAQRLPFRDGVFDAAAATFVFCSVPDPVLGLGEVNRVVREDGQVHLLEHVRAGNSIIGRIMDLLNPLAVRLSGANINRDTVSNVAVSGIRINSVESRGFGIIKLIWSAALGQSNRRAEAEGPARR